MTRYEDFFEMEMNDYYEGSIATVQSIELSEGENNYQILDLFGSESSAQEVLDNIENYLKESIQRSELVYDELTVERRGEIVEALIEGVRRGEEGE